MNSFLKQFGLVAIVNFRYDTLNDTLLPRYIRSASKRFYSNIFTTKFHLEPATRFITVLSYLLITGRE